MKVFLSHSSKDTEVVKKIAVALELESIDPWLCEIDIEPGNDFVAEIESGLSSSTLAILVWSAAAAESAWTGVEWRSVLAREIEESRTRLGVLVLDDTPLPELLRTKHHLNANEPTQYVQDAVKWVLSQRDRPRFESGQAAKFVLDVEPADFVGRADYFDTLHEALSVRPGRFLLYGEPGSGKSQLAGKFAWRAQGGFDAVVFQHCGQRSVQVIGLELAVRIGLDLQNMPPKAQLAAALSWLCERKTLLILDDVWNDDVGDLIDSQQHSLATLSVLFTSRRQTLPWIGLSQRQKVAPFSDYECLGLYQLCLGQQTVDDHQDALLDLASRFERLPIAVSVSARLLNRQLDPVGEATQSMVLHQLQGDIHDVPALFKHAIGSQPDQAQQLLYAASVCDRDGFWFPLAGRIAGLSDNELSETRNLLVEGSLLNLVDRDCQVYRLHALLRNQLIDLTPDAADLSARHVTALEDIFSDWEQGWKSAQQCLGDVLNAMLHLWGSDQADQMSDLAHKGYAVGMRVGLLGLAHRIITQEQAFWNSHNDLAAKENLQRSYGNQALILDAWGQLEEAMALHKQKEALCLELGNKNGLQASYGNQALILDAWGQLEEAMALHKQQEALCLELGNKDSLQICYGNQALILKAWGQLEEAMALHKQQEALCLELGNKNGLQASYGNQALILDAWGQLEEAMALHKQKEALCLELGNKDSLQRSYGNQALILKAWGQLEEAMALHKQKEALCLELGNKDSLQICYGNQALILKAWGQLEEAMALHKQQEALCLELGNKNGLQASYGNQALILDAWGQLEEAMALHKQKEALCLELGNKDSLQRSYGNQALILKAWGQLEEAMALHKQQEALCLELGNKDSLQICYGNQALILKAWGQLEEAMALHKQQEALCLEMGLQQDLGICYRSMGQLYLTQNNSAEAEKKFRAALDIFELLKMPGEIQAVRQDLKQLVR